MKQLFIYGASGHAEAVVDQVLNYYASKPLAEIVGFIDDFHQGHRVSGFPVYSLEESRRVFPKAYFNISVGDPDVREKMVKRVLSVGGQFMSVFEDNQYISKTLTAGCGISLFLPNYVSSNVILKDHVQIMPNCSIAHDVMIDDYSVLCPSVTVSGHVHIGKKCFIGAGSTIANGSAEKPLVIGDGAYIGLGSVVTKSLAEGERVFGNPARPIRRSTR